MKDSEENRFQQSRTISPVVQSMRSNNDFQNTSISKPVNNTKGYLDSEAGNGILSEKSEKISVLKLANDQNRNLIRIIAPMVDRLLGIHKLNRLYHENGMPGLSPVDFCGKFIEFFRLNYHFRDLNISDISKTEPVIIVANHPCGGIESMVLLFHLLQHRSDLKVVSNRGVSLFSELNELQIYVNSFTSNAKGNTSALRACLKHLRNNGILLLFPAGRVSYPQGKPEAITDHRWNRMATILREKTNCNLHTVHVEGYNRPLFYQLGKIWYRMRLLRLNWEMLASYDRKLILSLSKPIKKFPQADQQQQTDLLYLQTYLNGVQLPPWPISSEQKMQPVAAPIESFNLSTEISSLPEDNLLGKYKHYSIYWATQDQAPAVVKEIRRLREKTFRLVDEGSGKPEDGDHFDKKYVHLFVYDNEGNQVIGAYRMGRTDQLLAQDIDQLYLSQIFHFSKDFVNQQKPCLEMGRSFIVSEHQRSFQGLLLLFRGILKFLNKFPQYRTFYGTVSLSRQYKPLSVALIQRWLCKPTNNVSARFPFESPVIPQLEHYLASNEPRLEHLDWLIRQIEPDGKGLPVLLKKYHALGAQFHCIGIDKNFADTPGLLLSVDIDKSPKKLIQFYMGEDVAETKTPSLSPLS